VNPTEYYLRAKGKVTGPFDLPALLRLARAGVLSRADEVSSDREHWSLAGEMKELASALAPVGVIVTPSPLPAPSLIARAARPAVAPSVADGLKRASRLSRRLTPAVGITAGVIILLLLNLPVMVIEGKVLWFWSAVGEPGMRAFIAMCLLLLLEGPMLCVVSVTGRGLARGIPFVACTAMALLLLMIMAISSDEPLLLSLLVLIWYLLPALAIMLAAAAQLRAMLPFATGARFTQIVIACVLGTLALACAILLLVQLSGETLPNALVAAAVLAILACGLAIAAAALAVIAAAAQLSRANSASLVLSCACAGIVLVSTLLLSIAAAEAVSRQSSWLGISAASGGETASVWFLFFRLGAMLQALICVGGAGVFETMQAAQRR
jgi:hypothetical protein